VPYAYYAKLNAKDKAIYRRSDAIQALTLSGAWSLSPLVPELQNALTNEDRSATERLARDLTTGLLENLGVDPVMVKVLAVRPSEDWGELHGLYEPREGRRHARVTVWMRTAHHKRIVAFKTFLRTLLHEVCHHLDYELLELEDSFHTEGFFKRESSLFHQLADDRGGGRARASKTR